jgi:cell division protein FtsB
MNWSNNFGLFLMLAFLVAVFAIFFWFASQLLKGFKRERGAIRQALEKNRELPASKKITIQEFETIKRGLENS